MSTNEGTVALNNYLQSKDQLALLSWEESTSGPRHEPVWTSICKLDMKEIGRGTGPQKHIARDKAAMAAVQHLTESAT